MASRIQLFSLGEIWVSDFLHDGEEPRGGKHELKLVMEEDTKAVRLATTAPLNSMFGEYWYKSGINPQMVGELKSIVESILPLIKIKENDLWLDIGVNDGSLLSFVPGLFIRIGIDPAEDKFKEKAQQYADLIIQDYFSADAFKNSTFGEQKVKIITSIAMLYDVDIPDKFCKDIYEILDDEGLWVIQLSHSGLMLEQLAMDNILSEHVYYYTLSSLSIILERNGFVVVDCQLNETNGGSFRVYVRKQYANEKCFATRPYRDVCKFRVESLLEYEKKLKLDEPDTWIKFYSDIIDLRRRVVGFIKENKAYGKTFWAYSASTKGNTFLQWFGLDHTMIDGIAERSVDKWGLKTVGSNIQIYSEDAFRKANPDYTIILAWHFVKSFVEREQEYLKRGGKFITAMPSFEIISS